MSLKHALLGFLNYADKTGYELKQLFDHSINHFWNANLSQIYPTLSQMEKEGLLIMEVEYQENRPNRKVYHITDAGREELQRWLCEPMDLPPARYAFLIQVFFGGSLGKEEILKQMRHHLKLQRELLTTYQDPVQERLRHGIEVSGMKREGLFWGLTLEAGINITKAWIEWLEEAIKKIEDKG